MGMDLTKYKILNFEIEDYMNEDKTEVYNTLFLGYNLTQDEIKIFNDLKIPYFIKQSFDENYISENIFKEFYINDKDKVKIIFDYSKDTFTVLNDNFVNLFTNKFNELNDCYKDEKYNSLAEEYSKIYLNRIENKDNFYGNSYKFSNYNIPFIYSYRIKNEVEIIEMISKPFKNNNETIEEYKRILNLGIGCTENNNIILTYYHNNLAENFEKLITNIHIKNIFNSLFPLNKDEIIRIDW